VLSNIREFGAQASFRWRVELNAAQLAEAVAKRQSVGKVRSIRVASRDRSGRATRLELEGDAGSLVVERELNIRRTLGSLRSALFVLEPTTNTAGFVEKLVIRGGGFGHGVGMCQTGAIGAAQRGWTAEQILQRYYPGTSLRNLYAAGGQ
jgi:SpoIID/LytB domain protein